MPRAAFPVEVRGSGDLASPRYERRRPEQTVLYRIIAEHLEGFLREAKEEHHRQLPRYVERELHAYLECGIPEHGFLRAECTSCGEQRIVPFSCKRRGICPACNARRMCNTAAHLVDRVVPDVPVRQWVLSVPFELRLLLARRSDAFGRLIRIFAEQVQSWQRNKARHQGIVGAHGGGLSFPQRFGGSLNLNTHIHAVFADGVFTFPTMNDDEVASRESRACFHLLPPPQTADLEWICMRSAERFHRWLRRRHLIADEGDCDAIAPSDRSALDACTESSIGVGQLTFIDEKGQHQQKGRHQDENDEDALPRPARGRRSRYVGEAVGYHLHAAVAIPAHNRFGRELLLRYCARPPLSLERISLLPDGRVAYRIKKPWRSDQTHRVMTPTQFLARLVALIPPPRTPLIRFHGVFAPRFRRRRNVVPACDDLPNPSHSCADCRPSAPNEIHRGEASSNERTSQGPDDDEITSGQRRETYSATDKPGSLRVTVDTTSSAVAQSSDAQRFASAPWRIDWATLLKRVYDIDALACPCGGRLRFIELATEHERIRSILECFGCSVDTTNDLRPRVASLLDLPPPDS